MTSKAAATAVDFARIYSRLGLSKETISALQAFRKRHAAAQQAHAALTAQPRAVDFAHYRSVLRNRGAVDELERLWAAFEPLHYDATAWVRAVETFETKAVVKAEQTTTRIDEELQDLHATLQNIEDARPFTDLTVEEVGAAHPHLAHTVETMMRKGKWTVPGYKEKFGDLALM